MKHKFKNYLKLGILLFGISITLTNCEKDDTTFENNTQHSIPSDFKITKFNSLNNTNNSSVISRIQGIKHAKLNTTLTKEVYNSEFDFTINTDNIKLIEIENHQSYIFVIERSYFTNKTENLVLTKQEDNSYKTYLITYVFTEVQKQQIRNRQSILGNFETDIQELANDMSSDLLSKIEYNSNTNCWVSTTEIHTIGNDYWEITDTNQCQHIDPITGLNDGTCDVDIIQSVFGCAQDISGGGTTSDSSSSPDGSGPSSNTGSGDGGGLLGYQSNSQPCYDKKCSNLHITPSLPEFEETTPCDELKKLATPPTILPKFTELKNHSNDTTPYGKKEKGFKIRKNPTTNSLSAGTVVTGSNDGTNFGVNIPPTPYMTAIVHTHPTTGSIKMFSPQDILFLARMANVIDSSISTTDLTVFLIVNGESYAIRFDDVPTVQALQAIYNNKGKRERFKRKLRQLYEKDNNSYTGQTSTIGQQKQRMLTFLNNQNLNISMYQADDSNGFLTKWEKYNNDGTKAPCN